MKCFLYSKERRQREGRPDFFLCRWIGIQGDINATKAEKRGNVMTLNIAAVQARQINLTKSIFPATTTEVDEWNKVLKSQVTITHDDNGNVVTKVNKNKEGEMRIPEECVWTNLLYVRVPLSEISSEVKKIRFSNSAGKVLEQTYVTVIGIADENDVWAEELTAVELARTNLETNLSNGTYLDITDEVPEGDDDGTSVVKTVNLKGATDNSGEADDEEDLGINILPFWIVGDLITNRPPCQYQLICHYRQTKHTSNFKNRFYEDTIISTSSRDKLIRRFVTLSYQ